MDLCISVGEEVLARGMEEDRSALCAKKGQHDSQRRAVRWGMSPEQSYPSAAASLWEGLDETLTLLKLSVNVHGALYLTLRSTNPIENLKGSVARHTRSVKLDLPGSVNSFIF